MLPEIVRECKTNREGWVRLSEEREVEMKYFTWPE